MSNVNLKTPGKFIVVEAPDGCGKSTLIKHLSSYLKKTSIPHIIVKEPSDLEIGSFVHKWVNSNGFMNDKFLNTEALFLFSAQRIELIENRILPALQEGYLVLSDRFALSTAVYQDLNPSHQLSALVKATLDNLSSFVNIDATLFLDLDPKIVMSRISGRPMNDAIDQGDLDFHTCLRMKYDILLSKYGDDIVPKNLKGEVIRLDATKSPEALCSTAWTKIQEIWQNKINT